MIILTCRELVELITDAREGALGGWRSFQFRAHLGVCWHCRRYVAQMDRAIALAREADEEGEPTPPLDRSLAEKLRVRRAG